MISKRWVFLRSAGKHRWLLVSAGLVAVILISMVAGIISNRSDKTLPFTGQSETARTNPATPVGGPTAATGSASAPVVGKGNPAAAPTDSTGAQSAALNQPLPPDRLIVRNATVSLAADDVEKTLLELKALAVEKTGSVFQSSSTIRENKTYAALTIQVPSGAFDDTMNRLRKLTGVKVESENSTSQDVTEEYIDLKAQVTNLQATETELVRLLGKTNSVGEILSVQRELTNVRGEIDRRQGRLNYLAKKTDMSSITVNISPVLPAGTKVSDTNGWDPLGVLQTAWAGSVKGLQGLFTVLITLGAWAIWLGPIFLVGYLVYRRATRSRPAAGPTV